VRRLLWTEHGARKKKKKGSFGGVHAFLTASRWVACCYRGTISEWWSTTTLLVGYGLVVVDATRNLPYGAAEG